MAFFENHLEAFIKEVRTRALLSLCQPLTLSLCKQLYRKDLMSKTFTLPSKRFAVAGWHPRALTLHPLHLYKRNS